MFLVLGMGLMAVSLPLCQPGLYSGQGNWVFSILCHGNAHSQGDGWHQGDIVEQGGSGTQGWQSTEDRGRDGEGGQRRDMEHSGDSSGAGGDAVDTE